MKPAPSTSGPESNVLGASGGSRVYERWRWQIFAVTWLAYAGFYLTRKSFSVAKIDIGEGSAVGLSDAQMAWIDGAFLTSYALGQFFCGMAGDKWGARKVILAGIFVSVAAAVFMGFSSGVWAFALLFCLQGLAQSSGWAPLTKNVSTFFSQRERGTVMGLWCTNYAIGGLVASILAGYVGEKFGWRFAFLVPAAVLLLIGLIFYQFQRNRPEDVGLPPIETYHGEPQTVLQEGEAPEAEQEGTWRVIFEVLRNPMVLLLSLVYFCLKPARYAILFWGPKYVNDRLGTNMAESGLLSGMFELAGPISIFLGGVASDKIFRGKRMPVSVLCLFMLGVLLLTINYLPPNRWMIGSCLFVIGLLTFAPDSLISGTAAVDFGTKKGASTATGLINGCGSVGAIVGGTIPGFFQAQWGWQGVFLFLAGTVFMAGLLLLPKWHALPPAKG